MNNAELLALHANIGQLVARRDAVQETVERTLSDLRDFNKQIEQARRVTDVIYGVCLHIEKDSEGRWFKAQTLVETDRAGILTIYLYEMAHSKPYWAVRINEIGDLNRCVHNYERWFGGNVIGSDHVLRGSKRSSITLATG
jgi:hypothetical protein